MQTANKGAAWKRRRQFQGNDGAVPDP
ncbi:hypothetical protein BESB_040660 [Besnoitia besnoiti]|uniref:Uncharacterized protein n=1 Tax=Besnoitia besnoiti TaxID=94643 RepID=A0A2A9MGH1_BESBE|nr:hypothetical protein BESB_040660 [Besnoitia besnoiti]PFH37608.1 hypothetical protein BESB_040660 [Besnoitia besnoiti]